TPRYRGENEPIDKRAGHIPGAISAPFAGNLRDGCFLPASELRARYEALGVDRAREVIVYCGSGVPACPAPPPTGPAGLPGPPPDGARRLPRRAPLGGELERVVARSVAADRDRRHDLTLAPRRGRRATRRLGGTKRSAGLARGAGVLIQERHRRTHPHVHLR